MCATNHMLSNQTLESISPFANVRSSDENPPGLPVSQVMILGSINNY